MKEAEEKILTRTEVLARMREVWKAVKITPLELSPAIRERIVYNFDLFKYFIKLSDIEEENYREVAAIGFEYNDDEDGDGFVE